MEKKRVLVLDLDGTLYSINTFHYFLLYLIRYSLKTLKLFFLIKLLLFLIFRFLRIISHTKLKFKILKDLSVKKDVDYDEFVNQIKDKKRFIRQVQSTSFDVKILATAAPMCYASIISEKEDFDVCLATELTSVTFDKFSENKQQNKLNSLLDYMKQNNLKTVDLFITDHIDDAPIIEIAKENLIVEPNASLISWLNQNHINYQTL